MKNNNAGENMDIFRIKTFNVLLSGYTVCNILSVYFWIEKVGKGNMHSIINVSEVQQTVGLTYPHATCTLQKIGISRKKLEIFFTVVCLWLKVWNFRIYVFGTSLSI